MSIRLNKALRELKDHPFYIGVQYHPELSSTLDDPEQLFVELVRAIDKKEGK